MRRVVKAINFRHRARKREKQTERETNREKESEQLVRTVRTSLHIGVSNCVPPSVNRSYRMFKHKHSVFSVLHVTGILWCHMEIYQVKICHSSALFVGFGKALGDNTLFGLR